MCRCGPSALSPLCNCTHKQVRHSDKEPDLRCRERSMLKADRPVGSVFITGASSGVGEARAVETCIGTVVDDWGGLDLVVHSAGVAGYGLVTEMPHEAFDRIVRTNVSGSANV